MNNQTDYDTLLAQGNADLKEHIQMRANALKEFLKLSESLNLSPSEALYGFTATAVKTGILAAAQGRDTYNLIEQLGWLAMVFTHSTVPKNISWADFSKQWLAGIEVEIAAQNAQVDKPGMEAKIVQYAMSKNRGK